MKNALPRPHLCAIFILCLFTNSVALVAQAPPNDNCAGAITLTPSPTSTCASPTNGTTVGATQTLPSGTCPGTANDDVWYKFTASATAHVVTVDGASNFRPVVEARSGACNGTYINCTDAGANGGIASLSLNNLTVGTTYLVRVFDYYATGSGTFTICVTTSSIPANDNCSGAIAFPTIPANGDCATMSASTSNASQSLAGCLGTADEDVWFSFVAPGPVVQMSLTTNTGSSDLVHQVFSGSCSNLTSLNCSNPEFSTWSGLIPGATYYVRVYTWSSGTFSDFSLCIKKLPSASYDECTDAVTLIPNSDCSSPTNGTTVNATQSLAPITCGIYTSSEADDVWYKFVATSTSHNVIVDGELGFDVVVDVRTWPCNGANIGCADSDDSDATEVVTLNGLTVGNTYLIRVYGYGTVEQGTFTICVTTSAPPSNQDLRVTQILTPQSGCLKPAQQQVKIRIANLGNQPQSGFDVRYTANGSSVTETVAATVQVGGTIDYTFTDQADLPVSTGGYTIQARTLLSNDQNPANDNFSSVYYNLPEFDAGISGPVSICQGNYTYLSAYGGSGAQYQWSNGLGTYSSVYVNPNTTTQYTVTVTNSLGCTDVDAVTVTVLPLPSQPVISYSGLQFCQGGGSVTLTSSVTSNIIWNTGATTPSIVVTQAGYYSVKHVNQYGCETTSAWVYVSAVSAPTISTQSVGGAVCPGGSDVLTVNHGSGLFNYVWSTGQTTKTITVTPAVTTTYSVTVTNVSLNCVYVLTKTITVLSNATPGTVSNMLPPNGAQNVPKPVNLSWSPASNASHYDIFVWPQGGTQPMNPSHTTAQISHLYNNVNYGETYNWRVRAKSPCSTGAQGPIQTFKVAPPADLVVTNIDVPSGTVFSGTEATFEWQVDNTGTGSAGATYWYDAVYLSPDSSCTTLGDDQFLGGKINPSLLQPNDPPYTNSLSYNLPDGIEGKRFVLVKTDYVNYAVESNENNNCRVADAALMIELTPPPDLRVLCDQVDLPGVGNTVQAGETYAMSWIVRNQGLGNTNSGGWYDRVYLSADTIFSQFADWQLAAFYRNGNLDKDATYTVTANVTIPAILSGNHFVFISTDHNNEEYEHNYEFNNICRSVPVNVISTQKPDFSASVISAPATADNNEIITVAWQTSNQGAPYNGSLTDYIYLNTQPNLTSGFPQLLGSFSQSGDFQTGTTVTRQKTVSIPDDANGALFIIVKADGGNSVGEGDESNNAVNASTINIQSPNLRVPINSIVFPANIISGQNLSVQWDVLNAGPGKLLGATLTDRVSLSLSSNGANPIPLGIESGSASIFVNAVQARQASFAIPLTLSGDYYVVVHTNSNGAVYEAGQTGDNISVSSQKVHIQLADFPDLRPLAAPQAPAVAAAGSSIILSYQALNAGAAPVVGAWQDRLYLKNSPTWTNPSDAVLLKTIPRSQVLPPSQTYEEANIAVTIPLATQAGQHYLYVLTDAANTVFENTNENNNVSPGKQITVTTTLDVDLALQPTVVPASVTPGVPSVIYWKVTNNGNSATPVGSWSDRLYLSTTPDWPPSGTPIATWPHGGTLLPGQSYTASGSFTVPAGQTGNYYLILATDPDNATADNFFGNNYVPLSPSGGGGTIIITYPPAPDLSILSVAAPDIVQAGQPVKVLYTVKNASATVPFNGTVVDAAYRSTDLVVNAGDAQLATKTRNVSLPANATYTDTLEISIPASDSGNLLILVKTNATNAFVETNLNNNTGSDYLVVQQPPPADLVVQNVAAFPSPSPVGSDLTVNWRLRNIGSNPLTGFISEGVYLSDDQIWDAEDVLLGTKPASLALAPGNIQNRSLNARLEGIEHKPYWVIVRTDIFNNYPEQDENNNAGIGGPVQVEIPELPIGILTPATLPKEKPIYYRIEVPANLAGEMLSVEITAPGNTAFNELYLRHGKVPSRAVYDVAFDQPFSPNQRLIVPTLKQGTYYVMAYAADGPDTQAVNLLAKIVQFNIESVQADKGGNTGSVTVLVKGTKFDPSIWVALLNGVSGILFASNVSYVNSVSVYATFPLSGVAPGKFNVVAGNAAQDVANLPDGFEVIAGTIGNNPVTVSCTFDNGFTPLTLNALSPIAYEAQYPASARPNQIVTMTFRVENTSTVDVPAPRRLVASVGGAPLSPTVNELSQDLRELQLEFPEDNAPPEILRPGGVSYRTIYTKAIRQMQFNVFE